MVCFLIEIKNEKIKNGNKVLFDKLDLKLPPGFYQLNGQNGIGKSTFLKYIAGIKKGKKYFKTKESVFYLPEKFTLPRNLTIKDILSVLDYAQVNMIKRYGLDVNSRIKELSKCMLQKVGLIISLSNLYDILLYDEPFEGLDDNSVNIFLDDIKKRENITVIITCHKVSSGVQLTFKKLKIEQKKVLYDE